MVDNCFPNGYDFFFFTKAPTLWTVNNDIFVLTHTICKIFTKAQSLWMITVLVRVNKTFYHHSAITVVNSTVQLHLYVIERQVYIFLFNARGQSEDLILYFIFNTVVRVVLNNHRWSRSSLQCANFLTAHTWQKWKGRFFTCPCHKIYREEAVGLKGPIILLKLRFL